MNNDRISELDALRGVAAFTVLINHCLAVYPGVYEVLSTKSTANANFALRLFSFTPLHILWYGHIAVILFFTLSGFVLSVAHYTEVKFDYPSYLVKRLCRLYIPYAAIVTISVLLLRFYHDKHGVGHVSYQFDQAWRANISFRDYLNLLLLHGKTEIVDFPLWTIIIEIEVSFILPFFIIMIKKLSPSRIAVLIIVYLVALKLILRSNVLDAPYLFKDLYFLPFFLFGSVLYKYRAKIRSITVTNKAVIVATWACILLLCTWEWVIVWFIPYNKTSMYFVINDYMLAIGSIMLVSICLANFGSVKKILNLPVFQLLGKISYSLYLIHVVVIVFILYSFSTVNNNYLVLPAAALCLLTSYVYYLCIELPSIKAGKYLAAVVRSKAKKA